MYTSVERRPLRRVLTLAVAVFAIVALASPASAGGNGTYQLDGIGYPSDFGECNDPEGAGADFPILLTGNINGCLYQFWGPGEFRPSNTYIERGTELFVGCTDDGRCGSFETTYVFTAKYEDDNFNGQKFGRCQHPVAAGTGTGDFTGVTGRLDFKDDLVAGNFPLRGHLSVP